MEAIPHVFGPPAAMESSIKGHFTAHVASPPHSAPSYSSKNASSSSRRSLIGISPLAQSYVFRSAAPEGALAGDPDSGTFGASGPAPWLCVLQEPALATLS